jgi:dolichyl-phosphate beta-glucosyltransferase
MTQGNGIYLSIIIPAHNEEKRLPPSLEKVFAYLEGRDYAAEVLVVENGSEDRTFEVMQALTERYPALRVLRVDRRGKGLAVQRGMLEARGEFLFQCDADLSMPIEEGELLLPPRLVDFDVAIGSRGLKESRVERSPRRALFSWVFNLLTRPLLPRIHDSQCGFKCFRAEVADDLFRSQTVAGLSFDVEILAHARRRGLRIVEVPITWRLDPVSKTRPLRDGAAMVLDLFRIFLKGLRRTPRREPDDSQGRPR